MASYGKMLSDVFYTFSWSRLCWSQAKWDHKPRARSWKNRENLMLTSSGEIPIILFGYSHTLIPATNIWFKKGKFEKQKYNLLILI